MTTTSITVTLAFMATIHKFEICYFLNPKLKEKESICFLFIFYSFIFIILRNSFKIQNL